MRRLVFFLLALWCCASGAQNLAPVPELTARVIDQTGTLDAIQRKGLDDKLAAFEREKGTQIVVLMVSGTQPEDISSYANRVANTWKIGRKQVGDGVLVIVAKDDRRVRIEVAKTLEGAVPDLAAKMIIDDAIAPRFRQGDYAGGLSAAIDQLTARIKGEALPEPERPREKRSGSGGFGGFDWFDLAIFMFFVVPLVAKVLRGLFGKLGPIVTAGGTGALALFITSSLVVAAIAGVIGLVMALLSGGFSGGRHARGHGGPVIFPGGWGGGGGGSWGGGDGGGFGSGGGGDFGGGGASGDW